MLREVDAQKAEGAHAQKITARSLFARYFQASCVLHRSNLPILFLLWMMLPSSSFYFITAKGASVAGPLQPKRQGRNRLPHSLARFPVSSAPPEWPSMILRE